MKRMENGMLVMLCLASCAFGGDLIWDDRPAPVTVASWERERYPIGNGRLGAMLTGGVACERVQFNVDSLWTGDKNLSGATGTTESVATDRTVGDYQNFGLLAVAFAGYGERTATSYARVLDLGEAVHRVRFTLDDGTEVVREAFASAPADVIALRFTATAPFAAKVTLEGAHGETLHADRRQPDRGSLAFGGRLRNGLAYAARADWRQLAPTNLVVFLRAKTGYDLTRADFGLGQPCAPYAEPFCGDFDALKAAHVADYRRYYDRVRLDLADSKLVDGETTRALLQGLRRSWLSSMLTLTSRADILRELVETQFNFGRYLLISSSRPGTLPANLQGLWCNSNRPPWHADYHTNINLQMNYWGVDVANLAELWQPVTDWLAAANRTAAAETRKAFPNSEGVAYRTSLNAFGGGGWKWNFAGAPWLAVMAYDHYRFTGDAAYLRDTAWPLLRDAAAFMLTHLVEGPDGTLLVRDGWSPEHGPVADGVMHDQQLMAELLRAVVAAAETLGEDATAARSTLARLGGNKIGSRGNFLLCRLARGGSCRNGRRTSTRSTTSTATPRTSSRSIPARRSRARRRRSSRRRPASRSRSAARRRRIRAGAGRGRGARRCGRGSATATGRARCWKGCSFTTRSTTFSPRIRRSRSTATSAWSRPSAKCSCRATRRRRTGRCSCACCRGCRRRGGPAR